MLALLQMKSKAALSASQLLHLNSSARTAKGLELQFPGKSSKMSADWWVQISLLLVVLSNTLKAQDFNQSMVARTLQKVGGDAQGYYFIDHFQMKLSFFNSDLKYSIRLFNPIRVAHARLPSCACPDDY